MRKIGYMDVPMIANDPVFRKLAQISDYSTMSPEDQKKYERSIKVMRDNYATYLGAIQEGMEKGQTIGMAEGFAKGQTEGFAKGEAEGRQEGILLTAKNMKKKGLSAELIMEVTGLSQQDVEKL